VAKLAQEHFGDTKGAEAVNRRSHDGDRKTFEVMTSIKPQASFHIRSTPLLRK
jgi:hypothetical protein